MDQDFIWYGNFGSETENSLFDEEEIEEESYEEEEEYFEDSEEEQPNQGESLEKEQLNEEEEINNEEFQWQRERIPFFRKSFDNSTCGANTFHTIRSSALELFQLFFTTSLIQHIVLCTNLYATFMISKYPIDSEIGAKISKQWYPVTELEILAYFGTLFLSGVVQVKAWDEYFANDLFTHQSSFSNIFSKNRWFLIKRFLYFENPNQLLEHKLGKIWTVYTTLQVFFLFKFIY
jgi:hypothetical protein